MQKLDSPLRADPFSAEHLWNYAAELAARQRVSKDAAPSRELIARFESNSDYIANAYAAISQAVRNRESVSIDAEWLIDNYHVVKEQLREIQEDLPRSFYHELPKLVSNPWQGFPRVYELAHALVIHTDSSLDEELIAGFVTAYQRATPLTSGEIWAVPIMLRLVLVDNLRRLCSHMLATRECRQEAVRILSAWNDGPPPKLANLDAPESSILIMEMIECLHTSAIEGCEFGVHELAEWSGHSQEELDECVRSEHQRLAANQVSIGNVITSMRLLSALDWTLFFERVSHVEQILRDDPANVYAQMDFATRDHYRHETEELAKRSGHDEIEVASFIHDLASNAQSRESPEVQTHVGYYLVSDGRREVEKALGFRPTLGEHVRRAMRRHPSLVYLGGIGLLVAAGVLALVACLRAWNTSWAACMLSGALAVIPLSELAVSLVNFVVTAILRPQFLPKLEFRESIPNQHATLVVVPTMLTSPKNVETLLERLEIHYLANPEQGISYALLTDFADAPSEHLLDDETLYTLASNGINSLNERYSEADLPRFLLLHRARCWNAKENKWMGWERKRGKLAELNRLIRGNGASSFTLAPGAREVLRQTRYVITLDSDTLLPHSSAKRLIGAMAHPLNRPHFDPEQRRVTRGYGVLQPRVSVSLASATQSRYSKLFANSGGLDPYCTAVSDVYQDLFGEGSFTGKGIYHVQAFSDALGPAFPENQILSHDLIEGCHARVGLVTDVELFDEFPARVAVDARRQHRWVRGDWQLLPWLGRHVPTASGRQRNPLSLLSRWKIFDNLRRSLVPVSLTALLIIGWFGLPTVAWVFSALAVLVLSAPLIVTLLTPLWALPRLEDWRLTLSDLLADLGRVAAQCLLAIVFLPYRAYNMADAVVRTLFRLFVSRRNLLEWETADATAHRLGRAEWRTWLAVAWIPLLSLGLIALMPPAARLAAIPIALAWVLMPGVAYALGRPLVQKSRPLSRDERLQLRRSARRTWSFFETFVGPEDNWLPPDNFQEFPKAKVAHRTSPTNEGLFLVSALTAHEFGYISKSHLLSLLEKNLRTLMQLPRHRGHIFNWYDTVTLETLPPRYISTADNGNLAACLLTCQQGIVDLLQRPLFGNAAFEGILDGVSIVEDALERMQPRGARFVGTSLDAVEKGLAEVQRLAQVKPRSPHDWRQATAQLHAATQRLSKQVLEAESSMGFHAAELEAKVRSLATQVAGLHEDVDAFWPWLRPYESNGSPGRPVAWQIPKLSSSQRWTELSAAVQAVLHESNSVNEIARLHDRLAPHLAAMDNVLEDGAIAPEELARGQCWLASFRPHVDAATQHAVDCRDRYMQLARTYESQVMTMDFTLLYNAQRRLFAVGYNLDEGQLDRSHYDMLASEARIASLVAIAKGDIDARHWFQLGRALTVTNDGYKGLLSWGGTMFEYLMPLLFMRHVSGSLLEQSCRAAVQKQIDYGKQRKVPWGISESAFAALAVNSDYHYQSFGVPGLGLKQGLSKDLVIAPYATALALAVDPAAATDNLLTLTAEGALGLWGFYDAVDFTPIRVPSGDRRTIVFCYMAHHQGMILAALANALIDNRVRHWFQSHPLAGATDLLLQERIPTSVLQFQPSEDGEAAPPPLPLLPGPVSRRIFTPFTDTPRAHLLSNGSYSVAVTNSGGGYSKCRDVALTRWKADVTRDSWGQFVYLRDMSSGKVWSAGYQPTRVSPDEYQVTYSVDKAEILRRDRDVETHLEVVISPESNVEVRQVTVTNHRRRPVTVEATSYLEIVLAHAGADAAHPAFSKLFVETEFLADCNALLARRRPRDSGAHAPWAVHVLASSAPIDALEYETDRARFIGRGRSLMAPAAMDAGHKLSGTTGCVLDPVFSLRTALRVEPESSARLAFVTACAETREDAIAIADQFRDHRVVQRTYEMAWAHSQVELRHLHASPASLQLFQRLASALLFPDASLRADESVLKSNVLGQRSLWRYGISGDDPIVLLRVTHAGHRSLLREVLLAHDFWNSRGLSVDLVVVNEHPAGYFDELHEQLLETIQSTSRLPLNQRGGTYLLRAAQLTAEDSTLLQTVASINLHGDRGTLSYQVELAAPPRRDLPRELQRKSASGRAQSPPTPREPFGPLEFANHCGGFDADGNYAIRLGGGLCTPLPWSNVVANPDFGFLVTESGGGYTWAGNSRENKLTEWSNDPVLDTPSEVLYLRDEQTGAVWTPTRHPLRDEENYDVTHRRGSSVFVHTAHGIRSELQLSIAPSACVKFACLKLQNQSSRPRTISATYFVEWTLGIHRQQTQMHVTTSHDQRSGAVLARNCYHEDFPDQTAFLQILGRPDSITGDRTEFLGRNGGHANPAAMSRESLSGAVGAGLDPCGAVQKKVQIAPGEEVELIALLGWAAHERDVHELIEAFDSPAQVHVAIAETEGFWKHLLGRIEIKTPNRAMDVLVNHWLLYQVLSCRVWGRSAFYQSGGAFGFRDQLQDVLALTFCFPTQARDVILQAASRQFEPGDVQHWWHPPSGRGVRTRFADDYLWLPFATSHYVSATGDTEILKEPVHYLRSLPLDPHEEERYELPEQSPLAEDLFDHCVRAIDHSFRFGIHELPLMGAGDWNDGMNRVGIEGRGESVWLGWFLRTVLQQFIPLAKSRGDDQRAAIYRAEADKLLQAIDATSWDGKWYRRGYFDDGTPLGTLSGEECHIDSLAQSWAVLAGGKEERAAIAMQSVLERLVRHADRLVLLLTPPFDKAAMNPGYIKAYPPGIRENGGQYTHAATWVIQALARRGMGAKALELFDLLNPLLSASNRADVERYRGEPYVVAADVYSTPPHTGRGGWTWYTGSAAWMYRAALESILGITFQGDRVRIAPCIPAHWPGYEVTLRRGHTSWRVLVNNPHGVESGPGQLRVDGAEIEGDNFPLHEDGAEHRIEFTLHPAPPESAATNSATLDA